jgi:hypothetical protein
MNQKPIIDKEITGKKKPPVCPYCWETIEWPCFMPERPISQHPEYRYVYCPECRALLAMIPMPTGEMDVEEINAIIKGQPPSDRGVSPCQDQHKG